MAKSTQKSHGKKSNQNINYSQNTENQRVGGCARRRGRSRRNAPGSPGTPRRASRIRRGEIPPPLTEVTATPLGSRQSSCLRYKVMAVRGRPLAGHGEGVDGMNLRGKARGAATPTAWTSLQVEHAQGGGARGATSRAGPGLEKLGTSHMKLYSPGVSSMSTQSLSVL